MAVILPFKLKVGGKDEFRGLNAVSISYRFHGLLRLEAEMLEIQWGGVGQVQEVAPLSIRDNQLALPDERLNLPVGELFRASLVGGWWRPRLILQARQLGTLAIVPSEAFGRVQFWYARADRAMAREMLAALLRAMAAAPLPGSSQPRLPEGSVSTPPNGLTTG